MNKAQIEGYYQQAVLIFNELCRRCAGQLAQVTTSCQVELHPDQRVELMIDQAARLEGADPEERWQAVEQFAQLPGTFSMILVKGSLKDEVWFVRRAACRVLGQLTVKAWQERDLLSLAVAYMAREQLFGLMQEGAECPQESPDRPFLGAIAAAACWADDIIENGGVEQGSLILFCKDLDGARHQWI